MPKPPRPSTEATTKRWSASEAPAGSSAAAARASPHHAQTSQEPSTAALQWGQTSSSAERGGPRSESVTAPEGYEADGDPATQGTRPPSRPSDLALPTRTHHQGRP